ncbi:MAG: filamentous hemagglutinin N-terminal domain-containing protein, partial [Immundisolibacteraceae bacterium]|nr:filamentous hemagglutinin N-terminal domain-containing protein [Immundisolibacteraceae bacterium]
MSRKKRSFKSTTAPTQVFGLNPLSRIIRTSLLSVGAVVLPGVAVAAPQDGAIVAGQGAISSQGTVTTINQVSNRLAAEWGSFNISPEELVKFVQPSTSAIALNRILDQSPSQIFGAIEANGRLILTNPNGMMFAPSASVNVHSLIASGLDLSVSDFMAGDLRFDFSQGAGTVVNRGLMAAANGGSINLIGGAVANEGTIIADYGQVNLGAGQTATLDFDGDGLIHFAIDGDLLSDASGTGVAVSNSGTIQANGGQILLAARAAKNVFSQVVNNSGIIRAQGIDTSGGVVRLVGNGAVANSGLIDVSAVAADYQGGTIDIAGESVSNSGALLANADSGTGGFIHLESTDTSTVVDADISARAEQAGVGGHIELLGNVVELTGAVTVDASGADGGGVILVGGDYKGSNPDVQNAEETTIEEGVTLSADALIEGDGGKIIVWSDVTTRFSGQLFARGGVMGGNGGFAELSAKKNLFIRSLTEQVHISAVFGANGTLLLDPNDINIGTGDDIVGTGGDVTGSPEAANTLDDEDIEDFLENTGSLIIETTGAGGSGDILIANGVTINWTVASELTLNADRDITFTGTADISGTDAGANITLNADRNVTLATTTLGSGSGAAIGLNIGLGDATGILDTGASVFSAGDTVDAVGGDGTNVFQISVANVDSVTGGTGTDTIQGRDQVNIWNITGGGIGDVAGTNFTGIENLTGGSNSDDFQFATGSSVSGTIDGGGGTDTLDYNTDNFGIAVTVDLANLTATGTGGIANIEAVIGRAASAATNILIGANAVQTWNITGADDGNIGGVFSFTDMGDLRGGSNSDNFVLTGGGSVTTLITGNGGTDTVQGDDLVNTWNITGAGVGDVAGSNFTGIENLTGGSNSDDFQFASGASVTGTVDGGSGGSDTLDYETDNFNLAVAINLQAATANGIGGTFSNIDAVIGDSGFNATNVLVGADAVNIWNITGADDGNIGGVF